MPQNTGVNTSGSASPAALPTPPAGSFDDLFSQSETADSAGLNESALAKYPPATQARAKLLQRYDAPVTPYMLTRSPTWNQAVLAAQDYDHSFSPSQYDIRQNVKKSFASGQDSQNMTSLNTAIGHLDSLRDAGEKLDNFGGITTPLNIVANAYESATGDPRVNDFNERANAVATELTRAFRGSGGAEADVTAWRKNLPVNGSPAQQQEAIDGAIDLLSSRISSLKDKYKNGMGKQSDFQFLNDKARGILINMGYDPNKIENGTKAKDSRLTTPSSTPTVAAANPAPATTVNLRAPDGTVKSVPADQAAHYLARGATRVSQPQSAPIATGSTVSIRGQKHIIHAVHPDGSFDAVPLPGSAK